MNCITQYGPINLDQNIQLFQNDNSVEIDQKAVNWLKSMFKNHSDETIIKEAKRAIDELNVQNLFDELKDYSCKHFTDSDVVLNLRVINNTINIYQDDTNIVFNSMMSSVYMSFLLVQFYHSYVSDNYEEQQKNKESDFCNKYILFIINEMCYGLFNLGVDYPDEKSLQIFWDKIKDIENISTIASDLFYASITFALLHEMSHAYLRHDPYDKSVEKEIEADKHAYSIFLNYYDDIKNNKFASRFKEIISDYIYFAPIFLLDFYNLVFYTGRELCADNYNIDDSFFENTLKRKETIINLFENCDADVDENITYSVYNSFSDSIDLFVDFFVKYNKAGYFEKIKKANKEKGEKNNEQY